MAALIRSISRVGIPVNLPTGSTYDILLVSTPAFPQGKVSFIFEETPRKITGIQKVAQTFLKTLFTTSGSDVLNPSYGTNFPNLVVGANKLLGDVDFELSVVEAIKDAETQTKYFLNGAEYDTSSQLSSINILGVQSKDDAINLFLKLTTLSGESAAIALPFPELDLTKSNG
jgi:hypothetical protein